MNRTKRAFARATMFHPNAFRVVPTRANEDEIVQQLTGAGASVERSVIAANAFSSFRRAGIATRTFPRRPDLSSGRSLSTRSSTSRRACRRSSARPVRRSRRKNDAARRPRRRQQPRHRRRSFRDTDGDHHYDRRATSTPQHQPRTPGRRRQTPVRPAIIRSRPRRCALLWHRHPAPQPRNTLASVKRRHSKLRCGPKTVSPATPPKS